MAERGPVPAITNHLEAREGIERHAGTAFEADLGALLAETDVESGRRVADVGSLLGAAGSLLRRTSRAGAVPAALDAALQKLPQPAIVAWVDTVDADRCGAALARAVDLALDAALAESQQECEAATTQAMAELAARDRLESARCAITRREELLKEPCGGDRLASLLAAIDGSLRPQARALCGLNAARREERDRIDLERREAAWWYSARAECDELAGLLAGKVAYGGDHLQGCAECQRDLAAAEPVNAPMDRLVTPEALWRYDLGVATPAERAWLARRSKQDKSLAQALWAYEDGERAVAEVAGPPAAPKWELVQESPGVRLLLQRGARTRLMVRLDNPGSAEVTVLILPRQATLAPRRTAMGQEFDLGPAEEILGQTAQVTIASRETGEALCEIKL